MNKPKYHYDITQNTEAWNEIRRGRVGGSSCAVLTTLPTKKEAEAGMILAKGAISLAQAMASDHLGYFDPLDEGYMSQNMEEGHEYEPYAADAYALHNFQTVTECGYISLGYYLGYSPDRLVGEDGMLEIKCPGGKEFVRVATTGIIKPAYVDQMQFGLFVSGRKWCDHETYNKFNGTFLMHRFYRDEAAMERFQIATDALIKTVKVNIQITKDNVSSN